MHRYWHTNRYANTQIATDRQRYLTAAPAGGNNFITTSSHKSDAICACLFDCGSGCSFKKLLFLSLLSSLNAVHDFDLGAIPVYGLQRIACSFWSHLATFHVDLALNWLHLTLGSWHSTGVPGAKISWFHGHIDVLSAAHSWELQLA